MPVELVAWQRTMAPGEAPIVGTMHRKSAEGPAR